MYLSGFFLRAHAYAQTHTHTLTHNPIFTQMGSFSIKLRGPLSFASQYIVDIFFSVPVKINLSSVQQTLTECLPRVQRCWGC